MIDLDRRQYAEAIGEPEEVLDPIPSMALAAGPLRFTPFQLMLPCGDGRFYTTFEIAENVTASGGFVRYGDFQPVHVPFFKGGRIITIYVEVGDYLDVVLTTGSR